VVLERLPFWEPFYLEAITVPNAAIFIDESEDLGWKFDAPYPEGGSSRYLSIASICVPNEKRHIPKRVIRKLYQKFHWTNQEHKWSQMNGSQRAAFAKAAAEMSGQHPDIHLHSIVVKKQNVENHIRKDSNKLYNYMIALSLIDRLAEYDRVTVVPDPRSIKVASGNSLHDYLQIQLWFIKKVATELSTCPVDSKNSLALQFADMLAGVVQSRFEWKEESNFNAIQPVLHLKRLFF